MTRTYDHKLALPIRSAIRAAITVELQAHVKRNMSPTGWALDVLQLPGPLVNADDHSGLDWFFEMSRGRAPLVAVALGEAEPAGGNGRTIGSSRIRAELRVDVYFISSNMRDFVEGRLAPDIAARISDTADPGIDAMLDEGRMYLNRYEPELTIDGTPIGLAKFVDRLTWVKEWVAGFEEKTTIWAQTWSLAVQLDTWPQRSVTGRITNMLQIHRSATDPADPRNVIISGANPEPGGDPEP